MALALVGIAVVHVEGGVPCQPHTDLGMDPGIGEFRIEAVPEGVEREAVELLLALTLNRLGLICARFTIRLKLSLNPCLPPLPLSASSGQMYSLSTNSRINVQMIV